MKKKVTFQPEKLPIIHYNKQEVKNLLRDKFAQYLTKYALQKVNLREFLDANEAINYVITIFNNALNSNKSSESLRQIEFLHVKLSFLHYKNTRIDDRIHMTTYKFLALCSGDKKEAISMVTNLIVTDEEGKRLNFRQELDRDYLKAICQDVANLTKESVREFLQELDEHSRILTSAELAHLHKVEPSTDDSFTSSEHDHEGSTDRQSDSSKSSGDRTASQDSNNDVQQRGASLANVNNDKLDEDKENTNNPIKNGSDNESKISIFLLDFFSWVYELPEWLQEQILNSTPIQTFLEEAEKTAAILDSKYIQNQIEKIFTAETTNKSGDITEDQQNERISLTELPSQDLVDTTMVFEDPKVTGLILPMVGIGSGNIFAENEFGGHVNFNGLNGLEIF